MDKLNVISVCMKKTAYRYLDGFPDVDERGAYHTGQPIESTISCTSTVFMLCVNCVCVYVKCVVYDTADFIKDLPVCMLWGIS